MNERWNTAGHGPGLPPGAPIRSNARQPAQQGTAPETRRANAPRWARLAGACAVAQLAWRNVNAAID